MKNFTTTCKGILVIALFLLLNNGIMAQNDTIHVQTFTYCSSQDSFFVFPSDTNRYEKILMHYKLRCPYIGNPLCGQWDYLTYTNLYERTNLYDSTLLAAPSYAIHGASPDSVMYMTTPSYRYYPFWHTQAVVDSLYGGNNATVGTGAITSVHPFNSSNPQSRTQYLWKASELTLAGVHAGNITNLRLNVVVLGSRMDNLTIRFKNSVMTTLIPSTYETTNLVTAYSDTVSFAATGWNFINLRHPFVWDGVSNLVMDISYTNAIGGVDNIIKADSTTFSSGVYSAGDDRSLFFAGNDQVNVPSSAFTSLDSFITVAFWCYGDPTVQPLNCSAFEAQDSLGHRILNAHLPWSDTSVYWDAGYERCYSFDRINAAVNHNGWEGKWNYWTFTKNVTTGQMRAYLNGNILINGFGKVNRMLGIRKFCIGSGDNNNAYYGGNIDEFAVWNKVLDIATIQAYMYKDLDASHPFNSNLILYYHCNDNSYSAAADASTLGGHDGSLAGIPGNPQIKGLNLFRNFVATNARPFVIFSQDSITYHLDSTMTIDSIANTPYQIVMYNDFSHPTTPTDTLLVWDTYYNNYTFDNTGHATDSSFVSPSNTLHLIHTPYYSTPTERLNRYEIGRYITPYGIGLTLGNGFMWTYDVSDYASLLHDTVHLAAGNWQELLDVEFEMIKGVPPRDPFKVTNLWQGDFWYNGIQNTVTPKTVTIDPLAINVRYKMRTTGHGFTSVDNCAEFCPRHHFLMVNNTQVWDTLVWRNTCSYNPLYPQGGTWIYNRSNWCPGAEVTTYDFELTPYTTPGDTINLDYNVQPMTDSTGNPNYVIETQLISYSAPNFSLDAGIWDIISPSKADVYKRVNPICMNPTITIKNCGSTTLTSLTITYGLEGNTMSTFHWTGNLLFTHTENVTLPPFTWGTNNKFIATVSAPNGGTDQYAHNNSMESDYTVVPQYPSTLVFDLLTDAHYNQVGANEGSYKITDGAGNIVWQRNNLTPSTAYKDTLNLVNGCYEFHFTDDYYVADINDPNHNEGDGMWNWPDQTNSVGHMVIRKINPNGVLKQFGMDFGHELFQQFTVGYYLDIPNQKGDELMIIYPNPSAGIFNLDMAFNEPQDVAVAVYDMMGNKIVDQLLKNVSVQINKIDLTNQPTGIYFITVQGKDKRISRKLIKN